jgi:uncharacterized protein YndB with AHSA1/START domain
MTVKSVHKDPKALTMTVTAELDATVERSWQLWADPRQLERWWGPPTYPATVTAHDLQPGGRVEYHMTGPTGDQPRAFWEVLEVDPPKRLLVKDTFANADGTPNHEVASNRFEVTIQALGNGRTRMSVNSVFPSTEGMEQLLAFGMEEGITQAVGQIDAVLAEAAVPAG